MQNLMNEYIKIVKLNMNQFVKICIDNKYVKNIADEFIDLYAEIRYYGLIDARKGFTVKNKILTELRKKKDELIYEANDDRKTKIIELTYNFFDSCIALNEKVGDELEEEFEQISKLRKQYFLVNDDEEYKKNIRSLVKECGKKKIELLEKSQSNSFYLRFSSYKTSSLKRVIIKYNIKFPSVYSIESINRAFNSGTTAEDKAFVEYYMITAQVISDIENANYRKQYVVEFPETILEKPQKLARLLEIINHPSIQDRLMLNLNYSVVVKQREKVYELLRNGYKIALNIDSSFEGNAADIQRLSMFQYVIIDKENENYKNIINIKLKNIIEI